MKTVRVILIDPAACQITEHDIEPKAERYESLVATDCMESFVRKLRDFDDYVRLFIDELGGFKRQPRFGLHLEHGDQALLGKAVIIGQPGEDGEATDCLWKLEDVRKFIFFEKPPPPLPDEVKVKVKDLKPGMRLNLENDEYADPQGTSDNHAYYGDMYVVVSEIEQEKPGCIRMDPDEGCSVGFPPEHEVLVKRSDA